MRNIAAEEYEATPVGQIRFIRPDRNKGDTLESFQRVEEDFQEMEREGLIKIIHVHKESSSGRSMVDIIQIQRQK